MPNFHTITPKLLERIQSLSQQQREELAERLKRKMHEHAQEVLAQAFKKGVLSEKEYTKKYKDRFYGNHGIDSFIDYLNAAMNSKADSFVTDNERLLRAREELQQRFKLKILSLQDVGGMGAAMKDDLKWGMREK